DDPARPAPGGPQRRGARGRRLARRHLTDASGYPAARGSEGYRPAYRWLPRREGTHAASEADPPITVDRRRTLTPARRGIKSGAVDNSERRACRDSLAAAP